MEARGNYRNTGKPRHTESEIFTMSACGSAAPADKSFCYKWFGTVSGNLLYRWIDFFVPAIMMSAVTYSSVGV